MTIDVGGPWFEDFERGFEFDAPAVTIGAGHAALYQAMFGDRLRLPLDQHLSRAVTGQDAALVHPLLVLNVAIGQTTWASQRVKANLFYRGIVLEQPVFAGDTLHTRTRVVALRQNRRQGGRDATGIVALEMTTTNQAGMRVMHGWRCPMIPCRDPQADTGHADDLDAVGAVTSPDALRTAVPSDWNLAPAATWSGQRARDCQVGDRWRIAARDTITSAPELVRLTLNMAMAHTDAKLSYLGDRLVYGGHVVSLAFSQLTRALPNLLTVVAWDGCDHVAPVVEGDRLRTEIEVFDVQELSSGALLGLRVESFAARGPAGGESEQRVLDWRLRAWSA